jgi:hypothetical protein
MHVQIAKLCQQPLGGINLCSVEPLFDFKQARVIEWTRTHWTIVSLYRCAEKGGLAACAKTGESAEFSGLRQATRARARPRFVPKAQPELARARV